MPRHRAKPRRIGTPKVHRRRGFFVSALTHPKPPDMVDIPRAMPPRMGFPYALWREPPDRPTRTGTTPAPRWRSQASPPANKHRSESGAPPTPQCAPMPRLQARLVAGRTSPRIRPPPGIRGREPQSGSTSVHDLPHPPRQRQGRPDPLHRRPRLYAQQHRTQAKRNPRLSPMPTPVGSQPKTRC